MRKRMRKIDVPTYLAGKKVILCKEDPFFVSPQGEGSFMGRLSTWVRCSTCNLKCAWDNGNGTVTLCDTAYTSHKPERHVKTLQEIYDNVMSNNAPHLVITGGEPSAQDNLISLIDLVEMSGKRVTIETNGTKFFESKATMISLSPKLLGSSSGLQKISEDGGTIDTDGFLDNGGSDRWDKIEKRYTKFLETHNKERYKPEELKKFMDYYGPNHYQFKFVVNTEECVNEIIENYVKPLEIPNDNIYLMPQGMSHEQLNQRAEWVVEQCKKYSFHFSDRIHVRIWGNKTGV